MVTEGAQESGIWAIVTGGNRGIGLEICRQLRDAGHAVLVCSRNPEAGAAAVTQLNQEGSWQGSCTHLWLDNSDPASIDQLAAEVKAKYDQKVKIVVNNAAVMSHNWADKEFALARSTNYEGPVRLAEKLAPLMQTGGTIVQVSSSLGSLHRLSPEYRSRVTEAPDLQALSSMPFDPSDRGMRNQMVPTYCLTKAMLNAATQKLAASPLLQQRGITINSVCPGWCRTDMGSSAAGRSAQQGASSVMATIKQCLEGSPAPTGKMFRDGKPLQW